jgi:hypothetical protein
MEFVAAIMKAFVSEGEVAAAGDKGSKAGCAVPPCTKGFCWAKVEEVVAKTVALPAKTIFEFLRLSNGHFTGSHHADASRRTATEIWLNPAYRVRLTFNGYTTEPL